MLSSPLALQGAHRPVDDNTGRQAKHRPVNRPARGVWGVARVLDHGYGSWSSRGCLVLVEHPQRGGEIQPREAREAPPMAPLTFILVSFTSKFTGILG